MTKKLLVTALIFGIALAVIFIVFSFNKESIANFKECEEGGYLILESFPRQCVTPSGKLFTEETIAFAERDIIRVFSPLVNEPVSASPVKIEGEIRGFWFFEGSFPVEITDKNRNRIGSGIARAKEEWMTEEFVPFSAEIKIDKNYSGGASIIFKKDNPSGLPENEDRVAMP
ncbi:MAG: Gmad2 immunoglobulin-like domain-containing protein, partial [Candidatus Colwellbacteria bacterium]|nr:Gmad2 immunoglobulin-like domain-containing protein [Candidatus Colwellbacteria bacterium]